MFYNMELKVTAVMTKMPSKQSKHKLIHYKLEMG